MSEIINSLLPLSIGILTILGVVFVGNKEGFSSIYSSDYSMPKNKSSPGSGFPLFLNNRPKNRGADFKLVDLLKRIELNNTDPNQEYSTNSNRKLVSKRKLPPIILVPGLGSNKIFAKWNKPNDDQKVKVLDQTGNFEKSESWGCRSVQDKWVKIWNSDDSGLSTECWEENIKVHPEGKRILNDNGVQTTVNSIGDIDFDEMDTMIKLLEAYGYVVGENLFGAGYDFRNISDEKILNEWCYSMSNLIENACKNQDHKAIIIGHDLGSVIANNFLVGSVQEWKDTFIKNFISISGAFGGSPKAIREILGTNEAVKNFSGLSLMLPNPKIYGDTPLVFKNQHTYTASSVLNLLNDEERQIYKISSNLRERSMQPPGCTVYIMCGDSLRTESFYEYKNISSNPNLSNPINKLDEPFSQKYHYVADFIGDGTMPKFCLEYPIIWSKYQKNPVFYQFFNSMEHTNILDSYEPLKYLIKIIE